jgi:predicted SprT family Zn-dependent metalloprotease
MKAYGKTFSMTHDAHELKLSRQHLEYMRAGCKAFFEKIKDKARLSAGMQYRCGHRCLTVLVSGPGE